MSLKTAILALVLAFPMTAAAQNIDCTSIQTGITTETTCTGVPAPQVVIQAPMPLPALSAQPPAFPDLIETQRRAQELQIQRLQIQALQNQNRRPSIASYAYYCGPSGTCFASSEKYARKLEKQYRKSEKKGKS